MTLDDEHMTADLDRREALEQDRRRDLAERLHELELRDGPESIEAEEAHWNGVMAAAPPWMARQIWDGTT